jgi:putative ABC transport system permease protein
MRRLALSLALRIVETIAVLVPVAARAEWRREWSAELRHRSTHLQRHPHPTWRTDMDLIRRAAGSLSDAAWLRRQLTLDADAVHDAMHGVRVLVKAPAFTAAALVIFAVGIGATVTMVSVADALLLRPMPVTEPDRVMTIWGSNRETGEGRLDVAPANARDWIVRSRSFEKMVLVEPWSFASASLEQEPEYLVAARVGEGFFGVLGTRVLLGRDFLPQEHVRSGPRVAILSHGVWKERFGGNADIVGQTMRLDDGGPFTIVGVLPSGLELRLFDDRGTRPEPRVWLPKQGVEPFEIDLRTRAYFNVLGRLKPGVTQAQAQAELDAIATGLAQAHPRTNHNRGVDVVPLRLHLVGNLRAILPLLLGAALILLVVACANVANLVLARGAGRGREFAVRQALGASRLRLARQMLVETLLLAAAGGIVGLFLARLALDVIGQLRPADVALLDYVPIDTRAAAIASAVTLASALAAGLVPSLQLSRPAADALKAGRGSSRGAVHGAFVVAEIAAAVVLAVAAGLLVRSFLSVTRVHPGFDAANVSAVQMFTSPRLNSPQKRIAFFEEALSRLRTLPGVTAVGGVSSLPFGVAKVIAPGPLTITGRTLAAGPASFINMTTVAGDYFQTMGVDLVRGRLFDATDRAGSPQVVLVSRKAARQFWPDGDPIGSRVQFRFNVSDYDAEVVGIVDDARHESLDRAPDPELFIPYSQAGFRGLSLVVRTAPSTPVPLAAMKEQIRALDARQPIFSAATMDQLVAKTLTTRRFNLFLFGGFAVATLLLAAGGVYGLVSYATSQRTREFGVRLALGAQRRDIVGMVMGHGLKLAGLGVMAGIVLALPLAQLLHALLFGVTATDPVTFAAVSTVFLVVAAAACYLPTSRALGVDPARVLRLD